jgi:hypothetical protein
MAGGPTLTTRTGVAGIACTLFDSAAQVGGGWAEKTSAIWPTLRTNLPAMIMQFHDFSFSEACLGAQADDGPVSAKPESPAPESAAAPAAAASAPARAAAAAGRLPPTAASAAHPPESGTMATPSFVSPRAVASYLYEFHRRFLVPFIADGNVTTSPDNPTGVGRVPGATLEMRLLCDVVSVKHAAGVDGTQWRVAWQRVTTSAAHATSDAVGPSGAEVADDFDVFDAVVVANGHYNTPFSPQYTGQAAWPGTAIHSSAFRSADVWSGQRVVVVGAKSSGTDIARELVAAGCEVHVADKACAQSVEHADPHIHHHPPIRLLAPSGAVVFDDGMETAAVSLIINCTGYDYTFPFLENETVSVADRGVRPLYKHLFSIADPSLIFIGLPWVIIPFPLFDAQVRASLCPTTSPCLFFFFFFLSFAVLRACVLVQTLTLIANTMVTCTPPQHESTCRPNLPRESWQGRRACHPAPNKLRISASGWAACRGPETHTNWQRTSSTTAERWPDSGGSSPMH